MTAVKARILVVDDERSIRDLLFDFLTNQGYEVRCFPSASSALEALGGGLNPDVIISDLKMAEMDGMQFLKRIKKDYPSTPVLMATGFASVDTAIEAMKNGAYHYIVKPFNLGALEMILRRALERGELARDNEALRKEVKKSWGMKEMLGKSPAMKTVFDLIARVANTTSNVLINGESGTGKEMVARAIHEQGARKSKPFVAINCTAIPETLLESELFGHAKGSFTGAHARKKGLIEEANGGTLFLDEIGDMSPPLQAKLLRVLQERKIRPVGDTASINVDIRVIAATHKDLKAAIREEKFREDLFYRLSVIPIVLPPLRERTEDIPLLAEHFLRKYAAADSSGGQRVQGFTKAAVSKLMNLRWEGNVRELENIIERAVVLCPNSLIDASDIPDPETIRSSADAVSSLSGDYPTLEELEKRYIEAVLTKTGGRKDKAVEILGINRRTLYRKEREYGWVAEDSEEVSEKLDH